MEDVRIIALQSSRESNTGLFVSTMILSRLGQSQKQGLAIVVTELEIMIEVNPVQPSKHHSSTLVTESGIVMEVRPVQASKQYLPKLVTELGTVIEVKPLQYAKQ